MTRSRRRAKRSGALNLKSSNKLQPLAPRSKPKRDRSPSEFRAQCWGARLEAGPIDDRFKLTTGPVRGGRARGIWQPVDEPEPVEGDQSLNLYCLPRIHPSQQGSNRPGV